jgi:hypothetical protein
LPKFFADCLKLTMPSRDLRGVIRADALPEYRLEEIEGQRGDAALRAVRDPVRNGLPQGRPMRRSP